MRELQNDNASFDDITLVTTFVNESNFGGMKKKQNDRVDIEQ